MQFYLTIRMYVPIYYNRLYEVGKDLDYTLYDLFPFKKADRDTSTNECEQNHDKYGPHDFIDRQA
ncbi:hypothetical protein GCM10010913_47860 [Paenibacillus aceti]|uniref:Uncharacterized protein n=1 Tax=Paenibacillus aceti TaxID=1820010 RepID=A0ABQ1W8N2_9BACL|nr:hypothetical protein GCM10010913_47860 [Paenibacillus aceti]